MYNKYGRILQTNLTYFGPAYYSVPLCSVTFSFPEKLLRPLLLLKPINELVLSKY